MLGGYIKQLFSTHVTPVTHFIKYSPHRKILQINVVFSIKSIFYIMYDEPSLRKLPREVGVTLDQYEPKLNSSENITTVPIFN